MHSVTVSPKFQIVIPKALRERLKLRPGQKLFIYDQNGSLRLIVPRPITELRGMAKGIRWEEGDRDRNDRF
jgi:AbrB family looped-hinge helix DNA binding protein